MATSPIEAARALHQALEAGKSGAELEPLVTEDVLTTEHPNLVKPRGARVTRAQMLAASVTGAGMLARQKYEVRSAVEVGSTAILRLTWTGVMAKAIGPFREGQVLTAHIAQFIETRAGKVSAIETFDCYEPFV